MFHSIMDLLYCKTKPMWLYDNEKLFSSVVLCVIYKCRKATGG